ncbi:hypothetical protein [Candidatus Laterigemmans baculatus]|uniref:hypothetical protein n=1 Tax=Candidatus Laterigemmans baculatus TaxID=2770505 RepID=UPI0013D9032A|nr:hypothetical protein [Candidatus Laterigemmans baculatus]
MLSRIRALALLSQCEGAEIWSVEHCREQGVPEEWIEELADAFESGYAHDRDTIYYGNAPVNQFHGVSDLHLAERLGALLGIDVARVTATALTRPAKVRAIKEAVEEG